VSSLIFSLLDSVVALWTVLWGAIVAAAYNFADYLFAGAINATGSLGNLLSYVLELVGLHLVPFSDFVHFPTVRAAMAMMSVADLWLPLHEFAQSMAVLGLLVGMAYGVRFTLVIYHQFWGS